MPTHHELLGVKEDASRREINAAYRKLAKKYHPDVRGGDAGKFQQLTDAYSVLTSRPEGEVRHAGPSVEAYVGKRVERGVFSKWLSGVLRRRAFSFLAVLSFVIGLFLLDWGDGIHEDFNPVLLVLGCASILLSVGFFANRRQQFSELPDAVWRAVFSILLFLFDVVMRVYLVLVIAFSVVACLALINWLKKNYLHILPAHF